MSDFTLLSNIEQKCEITRYMEKNISSQEEVVMSLDRELISRFGNAVFQCPETVSIIMRVDFKDGSSVGFQKDKENEEDWTDLMNEKDKRHN